MGGDYAQILTHSVWEFSRLLMTIRGDHLLNRSALHSGQCRIYTLQPLKKLQPSTLNNVEPPERTMF